MMRYLVVNDDTYGYGSAVVCALERAGGSATLLDFRVRGFWAYLRDRVLPHWGIDFFRRRRIHGFEAKIIQSVKDDPIHSIVFLTGSVVVSEFSLEWLQVHSPSTKRILWLYDVIEIKSQLKNLLRYFDRIYTFQPSDIAVLQQYTDAPVQTLHMFCHDAYQKRSAGIKDIDICFVGSWHSNLFKKRKQVLRKVSQLSQKLGWNFWVVGGSGMKTPLKFLRDVIAGFGFVGNIHQGPLSHEEINELYQRSKVVLNCRIDVQKAFPPRTFEVTGSGTCLVTEYMENLETIFDSSEVAAFHDLNELESILMDLLGNDQKREAMAVAGMERTHREHRIDNRIRNFIS